MADKSVKDMTPLEILDKNLDQEQLGKDLAAKYLDLDSVIADVQSGKIDIVPGTDIDKMVVMAVLTGLKGVLGV